MNKLIRTLAFSAIATFVGSVKPMPIRFRQLTNPPRTHAHNDYEHGILFDALHNGFISVESDIWLYGGDLRVARSGG